MIGAGAVLAESEPLDRERSHGHGSAPYDDADQSTGIAQRLFDALCLKHRPTAAHSLRVTLGALYWATRLELTESQRRALELAALVHDVGKLATPDHLLAKRGRLTPHEEAVMRRCRSIGFDLVSSALRQSDVEEALADSALWFDGSRGAAVGNSLTGKILSIADAFDAMTTQQVYRPARTRDEAVEELWRHAGTQFDPQLVARFAELAAWDPPELQARVDQILAASVETLVIGGDDAASGWPPLAWQPLDGASTADSRESHWQLACEAAAFEATNVDPVALAPGVLAAATECVRGSFELTAAKLRGFISDEDASILSADGRLITVGIGGLGGLPFGFRSRRCPLRVELELTEFRRGIRESTADSRSPIWTRIAVQIAVQHRRHQADRGALEDAKEVLCKLRSYLMASASRSYPGDR